MKKKTLELLKLTAALAVVGILSLGSTAQADVFIGAGDGTSWEDPANWAAGVVPTNNGSNIVIHTNHQVVFDNATFLALAAAGNNQSGSEHRIARLLMGDSTSGADNGTHSLTFDQGAGITVRATNSTSAVIGGRAGKDSTLNILSGITNLEANAIRIGQANGGSGTINLSGGELILGRGGLQLGNANGDGDGAINITSGIFTTRGQADINAGGIFDVAGTGATQIGIGSHNNVDGSWNQSGILRSGVDSSGITSILIDDVGDDGTGGAATFIAGSILDPYDFGGAAVNVWDTVLEAEGGITDNGLALSAASLAAGWEKRIVGNELQVRLVAEVVPEPSSLALLGLGGLFFAGRRRRNV